MLPRNRLRQVQSPFGRHIPQRSQDLISRNLLEIVLELLHRLLIPSSPLSMSGIYLLSNMMSPEQDVHTQLIDSLLHVLRYMY